MDYITDPRRISFVIPHKGREAMLRQTLLSIARQGYDLTLVEVFVVTQNERLESETLPDPQQLNVTVVYRPQTDTIAALRNEGASRASGGFLAFLDADVEIAGNWIESMLDELHAKSDRFLVSSVQGCDKNAPPLEKIRTELSRTGSNKEVEFLPGANLLLKSEVFRTVGGFPEHLITCEDYFFSDKVGQLGKLYQSSRSEFIHLGEDKSYPQMFKKEIWRGQSNLMSIRGRGITLRELPSFAIPIWMFLFSLLAVVEILGGNIVSAFELLLLASIPVWLYAVRLFRIAKSDVSFYSILKFYALYFPARVIGLIKGIGKLVQS